MIEAHIVSMQASSCHLPERFSVNVTWQCKFILEKTFHKQHQTYWLFSVIHVDLEMEIHVKGDLITANTNALHIYLFTFYHEISNLFQTNDKPISRWSMNYSLQWFRPNFPCHLNVAFKHHFMDIEIRHEFVEDAIRLATQHIVVCSLSIQIEPQRRTPKSRMMLRNYWTASNTLNHKIILEKYSTQRHK